VARTSGSSFRRWLIVSPRPGSGGGQVQDDRVIGLALVQPAAIEFGGGDLLVEGQELPDSRGMLQLSDDALPGVLAEEPQRLFTGGGVIGFDLEDCAGRLGPVPAHSPEHQNHHQRGRGKPGVERDSEDLARGSRIGQGGRINGQWRLLGRAGRGGHSRRLASSGRTGPPSCQTRPDSTVQVQRPTQSPARGEVHCADLRRRLGRRHSRSQASSLLIITMPRQGALHQCRSRQKAGQRDGPCRFWPGAELQVLREISANRREPFRRPGG
jgi:hypothetical protein